MQKLNPEMVELGKNLVNLKRDIVSVEMIRRVLVEATLKQWLNQVQELREAGQWSLTSLEDQVLILVDSLAAFDDEIIAYQLTESNDEQATAESVRKARLSAVRKLLESYRQVLLTSEGDYDILLVPVLDAIEARRVELARMQVRTNGIVGRLVLAYVDLILSDDELVNNFVAEFGYCSMQEAADATGLSYVWVSQLAKKGVLTTIEVGNRKYVLISEIEQYLEQRQWGGDRPSEYPDQIEINNQTYATVNYISERLGRNQAYIRYLVRVGKLKGVKRHNRVYVSLVSANLQFSR